ncbi:centrosomal protein of 131 kDa-like isoform X2 [Chelonus insularis]|uniref:centrosomal protein of 131 kDa-like isoform X2 n=1 Tax=Chelonus insularis TaxID=460826 RepID=UPI00158DE4C7|nr:centrosomal protein of 131 kDa-like isoform X2 [Chelonus insularis]
MINIAHPKVITKPPVNKVYTGKKTIRKPQILEKKNKQKENVYNSNSEESKCITCADCSEHEDRSDMVINLQYCNSTSDCNQNIIDSDVSSFKQFCNIINDLEQTLTNHQEVVSIETCCFPTESNSITPEKDDIAMVPVGSTYDDIISFLNTLEQHIQISDTQDNSTKLEKDFEKTSVELKSAVRNNQNLMCENGKIKDELDTALLQLEDREATIKLLKEELKSERKAACEKLDLQKQDHSNELLKQKNKYQNIIKRHQKFIEQLIEEKKTLTEKCNTLTQTIKDMEIKQQKELKMAIEKQLIEIQRTKEFCMASEKIRRERWLEAKTSKIKEMTVKGLEPELRNMIDQHQQEIQEIRSTHMKELQEVELRAIRRSNQQLEQLRIELTDSHNKVLIDEKEAIRLRYQEKFDQQEDLLQSQQRKFFEELQIEKKKFLEEQARRDADRDESIKQIVNQNREKTEMLMKQFQEEKQLLKANLEAERNAWMENYKSQQNTKFEIAETRIREECNRERDRQIELAIARLEKETRDVKNNLQANFDKKFQNMKETYETELEVYKDNEKLMKEKLKVTQEKIDSLEMDIQKAESQLHKYTADLSDANKMIEKITKERDNAKQIVRQEIECEKRVLMDEITSLQQQIKQLNANRDSHISQLYSRIKLIITQKDVMIKNVMQENNDVKNKCEHLEKLINQQRKEYILKTL